MLLAKLIYIYIYKLVEIEYKVNFTTAWVFH